VVRSISSSAEKGSLSWVMPWMLQILDSQALGMPKSRAISSGWNSSHHVGIGFTDGAVLGAGGHDWLAHATDHRDVAILVLVVQYRWRMSLPTTLEASHCRPLTEVVGCAFRFRRILSFCSAVVLKVPMSTGEGEGLRRKRHDALHACLSCL